MKLFEFEAKTIFKKYGIAVPEGRPAGNAKEAAVIAAVLDKPVALKSQVLVSGRGKSGGIKFAGGPDQARKVADGLIGSVIKGFEVKNLLVEEKLDIEKQFYASVSIDRQARTYIVMASTAGGVDIEQVAASEPDKIARYLVDTTVGFTEATARFMITRFTDISRDDAFKLARVVAVIYQVAMDCDAELVEINPLVKTADGQFVAADARIIVDDNALFRHPEFVNRDYPRDNETPREAEARRLKLAYVDLPGDIGIVGNGAGLMMATVDLVHLFGGRAANFLDIGGGAQVDVIKEGVKLVMAKPEVRAVLVNVLGGITRCDMVARGITQALSESVARKPIVVRMVGTNEEEGIRILRQVGVHTTSNMEEAVERVVKLKTDNGYHHR